MLPPPFLNSHIHILNHPNLPVAGHSFCRERKLSAPRVHFSFFSKIWPILLPNHPFFRSNVIYDALPSIPLLCPSQRGGAFLFSFAVPLAYPHEPPKVKCLTKVYHPNIDLEGNVCLNILREDWKPVLTVTSIVYGLNFLFLASYIKPVQYSTFIVLLTRRESAVETSEPGARLCSRTLAGWREERRREKGTRILFPSLPPRILF